VVFLMFSGQSAIFSGLFYSFIFNSKILIQNSSFRGRRKVLIIVFLSKYIHFGKE
jgi:hypothetical protein